EHRRRPVPASGWGDHRLERRGQRPRPHRRHHGQRIPRLLRPRRAQHQRHGSGQPASLRGPVRAAIALLPFLAGPCWAAVSPCAAIAVPPAAIPDAAVGVPYSQTLTAAGPDGATFAFAVPGQALPPGLTLTGPTPTTVHLSGPPTLAGSYPFTVTAS